MYIGVILDYVEEKQKGELVLVGKSSECVESDFKYMYCEFTLPECRTIIHEWKVVMVEQLQEIEMGERLSEVYFAEKCTHKAIGINDDYPRLDKKFFEIEKNKATWNFLITRIPYLNPSLFKFFVENNFYNRTSELNHLVDERPGEIINSIKKTEELIEKLDLFSIDRAINSYEVKVLGYANSRPGKDDSASIVIEGTRSYWSYEDSINDPYINEILPRFSKTIARDRAWCPAQKLLSDLWEEIGGEEKRKELEEECVKIRDENISAFKKRYSKDEHFEVLRNHIFSQERGLRLKMEKALRKKKIY